jgi:RNA polymerase sigma factor (sigma-70 family)
LLLRHWTGSKVLAEDLAHDALLVTIERLRQRPLDEPRKLVAFLRGTARNLAIAAERRDARQRTTMVGEKIYDHADATADPAASAERSQEVVLVRRLIDELPVARDRELLIRYYVTGEPKQRICDSLNLESVHFNRVLHRARIRLRELFDQLNRGS